MINLGFKKDLENRRPAFYFEKYQCILARKRIKKKELNKKMQIPEKLKYEESESLSYIE